MLDSPPPPPPPPTWGPPEPLTGSPHVVAHALAFNAHAACSSSARAGSRSPATGRQRSRRETESLGRWESAERPADFSMCVHFLTINPTVHLAQAVPVMLTMQWEETRHPDNYHPRGNYKESQWLAVMLFLIPHTDWELLLPASGSNTRRLLFFNKKLWKLKV